MIVVIIWAWLFKGGALMLGLRALHARDGWDTVALCTGLALMLYGAGAGLMWLGS